MINHMARRGADVDLRLHESARPRLRPRQRRRVEADAEPGPPALLRAHPRRVPATGEARLAGPAPDAAWASKRPSSSKPARRSKSTAAARAKAAKVTVGRVCIDSGTIDEVVEDMVIRDRRHLSEDGFVLPIIAINKHTGKSEGLPEIVSRGFMSVEDGSAAPAASPPGGGAKRSNPPPPRSGPTGA